LIRDDYARLVREFRELLARLEKLTSDDERTTG
jgi:hypothetical protein